MKTADYFFEKKYRPDGFVFWNGRLVEKLGRSGSEVGENENDISTGVQKVFNETSEDSVTKINDIDKVKYRNNLDSHIYKTNKARGGNPKSSRFKYKKEIDDVVETKLNTAIEREYNILQGGGMKFIIISNIKDIRTGLGVSLGSKLSGYMNTFKEASNLLDEKSKRGEIQNEQLYQKALDKRKKLSPFHF